MKTNPIKLSVILMVGWILSGIVLITLIHTHARADVGVRPILPGGSNIQPEAETPIQMAGEVVSMNVRPASEADNAIIQLNPNAYGLQFQPIWYPMVAEVQAAFTMTNPTSDEVTLTAWFPLASALEKLSWEINPDESVPSIASFSVAVDGKSIDYSVSQLPNPKGVDKPLLPWASFPVTFPAGSETNIQVNYLLPLQTAVKGNELALYYIFQTGAGWGGPIGKAELILNLPYAASPETITRMDPGNLDLPYFNPNPDANLPMDGVMKGNQVRWTWTDFEPGPQDDFSIWLVDPGMYQKLEAARAAVQASPQDGETWLDLASIYRAMATRAWDYPSIFAASYLTPGLDAYQKASELLPEHPEPYVGLAMLLLAPHMKEVSAPSEVMGAVQEHLRLARELEAAHPNLAEQAEVSSSLLEEAMLMYFDHITATAVSGATGTSRARETEISSMRLMPTLTPTAEVGLAKAATPSKTPLPLPATPINAEETPSESTNVKNLPRGTILVIEIVIFAVVGGLVYFRLLRKR